MVNLMARLGARGRHNGANAIVHLAREVVGRRRTLQNAMQDVRHANILDALSDEDFKALDTTIAERTTSDREFSLTLARLTYAAARAKGFDRCIVDAALRLDSLIPADDPAHERDKLLRDAYHSAQKASYIRGGRLALGRLGRRAVEADDLERARVLLQQQLELGPERDDTAAEVDSALVLGDILRHAGDDDAAQGWYRRAATSAERLDYRQGVAEALVRQIDTSPATTADNVVALQYQALDAARRTGDRVLQARILVGLGDTLLRDDHLDDATQQFHQALQIAQATNDLALEARCLASLADIYRQQGDITQIVATERSALAIEERLGNRLAAANWALDLGMSELQLRHSESALDAFDRALNLGTELGDLEIQQRAEGGLGITYTLLRRGPETIDHLSRAIALARESHDHDREAQWTSSLGQAYWTFDHIDDAIRTTNDAIVLAERHRNIPMQAQLFTLLGQIYASQRETIRARDCFGRALQLNRDLHQTSEQITTLTALGSLAADTNQYSQATQLYEQALGLALRDDDRTTAIVLHGRMGSLAQKRSDFRTALDHYGRAVEMATALDDAQLLSRSLQHLATAQDLASDPEAMTTYERAVRAADAAGDVRGGIGMRINMGVLIASIDEPGSVEDAIGWLGDAANYALDAGPDYDDLRHNAEEHIRALGGGQPAALEDPYDDDYRGIDETDRADFSGHPDALDEYDDPDLDMRSPRTPDSYVRDDVPRYRDDLDDLDDGGYDDPYVDAAPVRDDRYGDAFEAPYEDEDDYPAQPARADRGRQRAVSPGRPGDARGPSQYSAYADDGADEDDDWDDPADMARTRVRPVVPAYDDGYDDDRLDVGGYGEPYRDVAGPHRTGRTPSAERPVRGGGERVSSRGITRGDAGDVRRRPATSRGSTFRDDPYGDEPYPDEPFRDDRRVRTASRDDAYPRAYAEDVVDEEPFDDAPRSRGQGNPSARLNAWYDHDRWDDAVEDEPPVRGAARFEPNTVGGATDRYRARQEPGSGPANRAGRRDRGGYDWRSTSDVRQTDRGRSDERRDDGQRGRGRESGDRRATQTTSARPRRDDPWPRRRADIAANNRRFPRSGQGRRRQPPTDTSEFDLPGAPVA